MDLFGFSNKKNSPLKKSRADDLLEGPMSQISNEDKLGILSHLPFRSSPVMYGVNLISFGLTSKDNFHVARYLLNTEKVPVPLSTRKLLRVVKANRARVAVLEQRDNCATALAKYTGPGTAAMPKIKAIFKKVPQISIRLADVHVDRFNTHSLAKLIIAALKTGKGKDIELDGSRIDAALLKSTLLPALSSLTKSNDKKVQRLLSGVSLSLTLKNCNLTAEDVNDLLKALKDSVVTELNLAGNAIGNKGMLILLNNLPTRLKSLDLSNNGITGSGCGDIDPNPTEPLPRDTLERFNLSNNDLGATGWIMLPVASSWGRLRELNLSNTNLPVDEVRERINNFNFCMMRPCGPSFLLNLTENGIVDLRYKGEQVFTKEMITVLY
ncbi:MAG: hypothetical protein JWQ23_1842 [Herminiimonas sp.]|nr:hypothetical protein [Herminiimonas sp.]